MRHCRLSFALFTVLAPLAAGAAGPGAAAAGAHAPRPAAVQAQDQRAGQPAEKLMPAVKPCAVPGGGAPNSSSRQSAASSASTKPAPVATSSCTRNVARYMPAKRQAIPSPWRHSCIIVQSPA